MRTQLISSNNYSFSSPTQISSKAFLLYLQISSMILHCLRPSPTITRPVSTPKTRKGISLSLTHRKHAHTPTKKITIPEYSTAATKKQDTATRAHSRYTQNTNLSSAVKAEEGNKLNDEIPCLPMRRLRERRNEQKHERRVDQFRRETMAKLNEIDGALRGIIAFTYRK